MRKVTLGVLRIIKRGLSAIRGLFNRLSIQEKLQIFLLIERVMRIFLDEK